MAFWNRRTSIDALNSIDERHRLKRTLRWPHLVALGVGATAGTGIYTLIGIGAGRAGPAVILAFVIAGVVCACAALCYAELATVMPVAGSAYTYTYAVGGELVGEFLMSIGRLPGAHVGDCPVGRKLASIDDR